MTRVSQQVPQTLAELTSAIASAPGFQKILDEREVPCERLNEMTVVVRGTKNERKVREMKETLEKQGLFLE